VAVPLEPPQQARELGLAGYVPRSVLAAKLPRLLRRLQRHRHPG